jgi:hypothetical protein
LNKQNFISLEKIEKGLSYLKLQFTENERKTVLLPFLSTFKTENITVADSEEYNFRNFLACLFILSKSTKRDKAKALFRLYDYANNDALSKKEIDYMLSNILNSVLDYSHNIYEGREARKNLADLFDINKQEAALKRQRRVCIFKIAYKLKN